MIYFKLFLICLVLNLTHSQTNIKLTVQNSYSYNGPQIMGVNMGHSGVNSNWAKFLERLGVNGARIFVSFATDLRNLIGTTQWGKNLNGVNVVDQPSFVAAVTTLRTANGRNQTYPWTNPINWTKLTAAMQSLSPPIYGTTDNTAKNLNYLKLQKLFVINIGCGGASTNFVFSTLDRTTSAYWAERWELYKFSYATAIYARNYGVTMVEFFNEPDLLLGNCLSASQYQDYYLIRSLSIQDAYNDCNQADPLNKISLQIVASAFARRTFGGDSTQYLGDVSVNNTNLYFTTNTKNSNWTNMQLYSYHSYGKTGPQQSSDFTYLTQGVNAANPSSKPIPVIITEHNSHTASDWNTIKSTADDTFESSRLAAQIINLVATNSFSSHFVFKFSITPSFASNREVAKNGLHWGEIYNDPYHIADTTLSAESFRLLTQMKKSQIYPVTTNDTTSSRTYLASNDGNGTYYLYIVNDNTSPITLSFDLTAWGISDLTQILVETVSSNYWGEISNIITTKNRVATIPIDPTSTTRLLIQTGVQSVTTTVSNLTCTARAGVLSNQASCSNTNSDVYLYSGTSNTAHQEFTSVALISFPIFSMKKNQKVVLKVMINSIIGNKSTQVTVLGVKNPAFILNSNSASWSTLNTLVNPLASGAVIANISSNFINWSSNANYSIAGHILASNQTNNQFEMIDVSYYVNQVVSLGGTQLTFLLYRPFRHPSYQTGVGPIPADDLSQGSIIKFFGANSANPPQISYFSAQ